MKLQWSYAEGEVLKWSRSERSNAVLSLAVTCHKRIYSCFMISKGRFFMTIIGRLGLIKSNTAPRREWGLNPKTGTFSRAHSLSSCAGDSEPTGQGTAVRLGRGLVPADLPWHTEWWMGPRASSAGGSVLRTLSPEFKALWGLPSRWCSLCLALLSLLPGIGKEKSPGLLKNEASVHGTFPQF